MGKVKTRSLLNRRLAAPGCSAALRCSIQMHQTEIAHHRENRQWAVLLKSVL
jgi:hypothetical protein